MEYPPDIEPEKCMLRIGSHCIQKCPRGYSICCFECAYFNSCKNPRRCLFLYRKRETKQSITTKARYIGTKTAHDVKYLWNIFVNELKRISMSTQGQIVNVLRVFRSLNRSNIRISGILRVKFVKQAIEIGLLGKEIEHIKNKRWLFQRIDPLKKEKKGL